MRKAALVVAGLLLSCIDAPAADRPPSKRDDAKRVKGTVVRREARPSVLTQITYDTGINAGFHPDGMNGGGNVNRTVGNRFNSLFGGPLLMTGMVARMTVFPAISGSQSVSIADIPTTMNTAKVLYFVNVDLVANQFNVIDLDPAITVRWDFLGTFVGAFNVQQGLLLGMSDMSNQGQGYHAIQAFYTGGLQTMIQVVPNRNAMLRVMTDQIPIELMDFRIE